MNDRERVQLEQTMYTIGLCLLGAGVLLLFIGQRLPSAAAALWSVPCMFHAVTGLYCPGCGGTRAAALLLRGEIGASLWYHPIVVYSAAVYAWFMVSHTAERLMGHRWRIGMRYRNLYLWLALAITVVNVAVKDFALAAFQIDFLKILDGMYF